MDVTSYIAKGCKNNKETVFLTVNANMKAWDVTDFNKGQTFSAYGLNIPDEIAQSKAVGQAFFISARKNVYPIYTAERY